jgi:hypothetical protein
MSLIDAIFKGKKIPVPEDVKKELIPGEQVLHSVRQARIEQPITPDYILVTTERVMIRRPDWWGLTARNIDHRYEDMGNVIVRRGILNSTIHVKMRFGSHDVDLRAIPNSEAPLIARSIQEGVDGRFEHVGSGYSGGGPSQQAVQNYVQPVKPQGRVPTNEELLSFLKYRYASGEITKDEFERMKKDIMS